MLRTMRRGERMANYRRLISYIYAYEGETKGRNIGFVKLESRNGQCRLSISVKKVYVGGSDLGVYLLSPGKEIGLGTIFIRGGAGEFRATVPVENVADSGIGMEACYGLSIHEPADSWRSYRTIWEDAVAHAAQVELAEASGENRMKREEIHREAEKIAARLDQEIQENVKEDKAGEREPFYSLQPVEPEEIQVLGPGEKATIAESPDVQKPSPLESGETEKLPSEARPQERQAPKEDSQQPAIKPEAEQIQAETAESSEPGELILEDPRILEQLEEEEKSAMKPGELWESFRKRWPKIQAFDCAGGCEILTIKPQDIGLMPREIWTYGNNSFLLHGYYNYRYLILAKVNIPGREKSRYILGVPGNYYSNEKYMASMFGFPHFVLAKGQSTPEGRFGYWYTDVRLDPAGA